MEDELQVVEMYLEKGGVAKSGPMSVDHVFTWVEGFKAAHRAAGLEPPQWGFRLATSEEVEEIKKKIEDDYIRLAQRKRADEQECVDSGAGLGYW